MSDSLKKTINAKLILKDIQTGMDEEEIKRKYRLTDKGFQSVFQKLSAMGLLMNADNNLGLSTPRQNQRLAQREAPITWRCPACGEPQARAYEECPHCGVIVAKFSAMTLQGHTYPQTHNYETHDAEASFSKRWPIIVLSILIFLVVGGAILKWSSHKGTKPSISASASTPGSVLSFTTTNFEREVKEASKTMPVLIMFYADW